MRFQTSEETRGFEKFILKHLPKRAFSFLVFSYLCFESSKSGSSKRNKVIKLSDITDIQKVCLIGGVNGGENWFSVQLVLFRICAFVILKKHAIDNLGK